MKNSKLRLKQIAQHLKKELAVYRLVLGHPQTPRLARFFLWLAIGYLMLPFDLIPDFIPVLGQLDDVLIVPGLIYLALKIVPNEVVAQCRAEAKNMKNNESGHEENGRAE